LLSHIPRRLSPRSAASTGPYG